MENNNRDRCKVPWEQIDAKCHGSKKGERVNMLHLYSVELGYLLHQQFSAISYATI